MNLTKISLHHDGDNGALIMFQLFITERFSLLAIGHCVQCGKEVSVEIPFTDLYDSMPSPHSEDVEAERLLMHSLGIRPDEPPLLEAS